VAVDVYLATIPFNIAPVSNAYMATMMQNKEEIQERLFEQNAKVVREYPKR
jgi:hypothetical protein